MAAAVIDGGEYEGITFAGAYPRDAVNIHLTHYPSGMKAMPAFR